MTAFEIASTIAQMIGCKDSDIKNIDTENCTFQKGTMICAFDFTPSGKKIKSNSVRNLFTVSNFKNCIIN